MTAPDNSTAALTPEAALAASLAPTPALAPAPTPAPAPAPVRREVRMRGGAPAPGRAPDAAQAVAGDAAATPGVGTTPFPGKSGVRFGRPAGPVLSNGAVGSGGSGVAGASGQPTGPRAQFAPSARSARSAQSVQTVRRVFPDGYDLDAEAVVLANFLGQSEVATSDPSYARYEAYQDRLQQWARLERERAQRASAEADVPTGQAQKMQQLGGLEAEEEDAITISTAEALRLFMGVAPDPQGNRFGVPGGRRAATSLRQLFMLTATDNPYADWALYKADEQLAAIEKLIVDLEAKYMRVFSQAAARGLKYSLMKSRAPQTVAVGFRSPYGYSVINIIALYDHYVLVVKSLYRRNLLSMTEHHEALLRVKSACRVMFDEANKSSRILLDERLRGLSRTDWIPQADPAVADLAIKRVQAATALLGEIPREVFTGTHKPRQSLNRTKLSARDLAVLKQLTLTIGSAIDDKAEADAQAALAVQDTSGLVD